MSILVLVLTAAALVPDARVQWMPPYGGPSVVALAGPTPYVGRGPDSLAVNQAEYEGWKSYHTYCDRCHGQDAVGSALAPNLRRSVGPEGSVTVNVFIQKVSDGVVDKGMPAWKDVLSREQMQNIWAYLAARSSGRLAPGRPHVASGASARS